MPYKISKAIGWWLALLALILLAIVALRNPGTGNVPDRPPGVTPASSPAAFDTGGYTSPASVGNPIALGGCVVRFDTLSPSGKSVVPRIHANSAHQCVGITSVAADWSDGWSRGDLIVTADGGNDVVTFLVGSDESFARRGIMCGPSGGGAVTHISCYRGGVKVPAYSLQLYGPGMNLWLIALWWAA